MAKRKTESAADTASNGAFRIAGHDVGRGERKRIDLPIAALATRTQVAMPVTVVNGAGPGPVLWLSAAVHGDELNGIEIVRQVLAGIGNDELSGTLVAVPLVNPFGFIHQSRYLPDRRDLNRAFPGSKRGSLAARIAHLFMTEIVERADFGIDLHTAAEGRTNLGQIRAALDDPETRKLAKAFGAPVAIHSATRDGSLREAATAKGCRVLLYEGGEPMRFNRDAVRLGTEGVLRVMSALGMIAEARAETGRECVVFERSRWIRARYSGIARLDVDPGETVFERQRLGVIADAFGDGEHLIKAPSDGIVIGLALNPIVNRGDGLIHLATRNGGPPEATDG